MHSILKILSQKQLWGPEISTQPLYILVTFDTVSRHGSVDSQEHTVASLSLSFPDFWPSVYKANRHISWVPYRLYHRAFFHLIFRLKVFSSHKWHEKCNSFRGFFRLFQPIWAAVALFTCLRSKCILNLNVSDLYAVLQVNELGC